MRLIAITAMLLVSACNGDGTSGGDGGFDASIGDLPNIDASARDARMNADLAPARCQLATDCRLFSSQCSTDPCRCLALGAQEPDPVCTGQTVSCFTDPCAGAIAVCSPAGVCAEQ